MTNMTNKEMEALEAVEAAKPKKETFTIRLTVENKEEAAWIHDSMKGNTIHHGVKVTAISNGNMFEELNLREQEIEIHEEHSQWNMTEDNHEKIKWIHDEIEDAGKRYQ